jgi:hypothetical protein
MAEPVRAEPETLPPTTETEPLEDAPATVRLPHQRDEMLAGTPGRVVVPEEVS